MFSENTRIENRHHEDELRIRKATQARIRRNSRSGLEFEEEMFSNRSRYLVLHVTVNYKNQYRDDVTLNTIQLHRDKFFRHIQEYPNALLQKVRGVIWKLEEGNRSGGLHLHLLIFYSAERKADVMVAQAIGEYWVNEVTDGWGGYWNSNANKHQLERWGVGIGQVNRHDNSRRESLQAFIANYLSKANQIPRDRTEDDKLFGARIFDRHRAIKRRLCS
ncbi:hypothetical protein [Variovorax boronicumulans]